VLGSSHYILPQFWEKFTLADTASLWPHTNRPTHNAQIQWKQALAASLHLGSNQCLALPLGKWYAHSTPKGWYYHRVMHALWVKREAWQQYAGILQRMRQLGFHIAGTTEGPPPAKDLEQAMVTHCRSKWLLTGSSLCKQSTLGIDPCQQL